VSHSCETTDEVKNSRCLGVIELKLQLKKNTKKLIICLSVSIRTRHSPYRSTNQYCAIVCVFTRLTLHQKCSSSTDSSSCRTYFDWCKRLTLEFL